MAHGLMAAWNTCHATTVATLFLAAVLCSGLVRNGVGFCSSCRNTAQAFVSSGGFCRLSCILEFWTCSYSLSADLLPNKVLCVGAHQLGLEQICVTVLRHCIMGFVHGFVYRSATNLIWMFKYVPQQKHLAERNSPTQKIRFYGSMN
jgi:hypothetical protein